VLERFLTEARRLAREIVNPEGAGLGTYHYFERAVGLVLSAVMSVVILLSLYYIARALFETFTGGPVEFDYSVFQRFFEMVLTTLIALEFNHTLTQVVAGRGSLIQVRTVVLIGILVIVRKFILIDVETTSASFLMALALAILALGAVYWLVVDVDRRVAQEQRETPKQR